MNRLACSAIDTPFHGHLFFGNVFIGKPSSSKQTSAFAHIDDKYVVTNSYTAIIKFYVNFHEHRMV